MNEKIKLTDKQVDIDKQVGMDRYVYIKYSKMFIIGKVQTDVHDKILPILISLKIFSNKILEEMCLNKNRYNKKELATGQQL